MFFDHVTIRNRTSGNVSRLRYNGNMDSYISTEKLIEESQKNGVDFGKGNPYNRLRYYTKMGWLPHMIRTKGGENDVKGHFPAYTLKRLLYIEKLKGKGLSNEEIELKIQTINKWETVANVINFNSLKSKLMIYGTVVLLLIIVAAEIGLIKIGKPKDLLVTQILQSIK
jgi:hypothetical protein